MLPLSCEWNCPGLSRALLGTVRICDVRSASIECRKRSLLSWEERRSRDVLSHVVNLWQGVIQTAVFTNMKYCLHTKPYRVATYNLSNTIMYRQLDISMLIHFLTQKAKNKQKIIAPINWSMRTFDLPCQCCPPSWDSIQKSCHKGAKELEPFGERAERYGKTQYSLCPRPQMHRHLRIHRRRRTPLSTDRSGWHAFSLSLALSLSLSLSSPCSPVVPYLPRHVPGSRFLSRSLTFSCFHSPRICGATTLSV